MLRGTALCVCSAATWGEILITFRISAVSVDNEVILPWERWYCMQPIPFWDKPFRSRPHQRQRYCSPVGRTRKTHRSQCEGRVVFNNNAVQTECLSLKKKLQTSVLIQHLSWITVNSIRRRSSDVRNKVHRPCCSFPMGSSQWPSFHSVITATFCPSAVFLCPNDRLLIQRKGSEFGFGFPLHSVCMQGSSWNQLLLL